MAVRLARPYALVDDLRLDVLECIVDGAANSEIVDLGFHRIDVGQVDNWRRLRIRVEVTATPDTAKALPPSERTAPPWRAALTAVCKDTKLRRGFPLDSDGNGQSWHGEIELASDDLHGSCALTACLVRNTDITRIRGYASRAGTVLAVAPEFTVTMDERPAPAGGLVRWQWKKFSEEPTLRTYSRATHLIGFEDTPVLYLNEEVASFKHLLLSKKKQGPEAAHRDALIDAIVRSVWPTILVAAAAGTTEGEDHRLAATSDWASRALQYFAPKITGEDDVSIAVHDLASKLRSGDEAPEILSRIEAYIQNHFKMRVNIERLLTSTTFIGT